MDIIGLLAFIPYGKEVLVLIGTATTAISIVGPIIKKIVQKTETRADDELLEKIRDSGFLQKFAWVAKQVNRFSLFR